MKCHHCPNDQIRWRDKACAQCGAPTTVNALLVEAGQHVRAQCQRLTTVRCPECGRGVSMRARVCPRCGAGLSIGAAAAGLWAPVDRRRQALLAQPPATLQRLLQWSYVLGSGALVGALLVHLGRWDGESLLKAAVLAVPHVAVFLYLLVWLRPQTFLQRLAQRTSALVKVGLGLNLIASLLLLQCWVHTTWKHSLILAGTAVIAWAGAWGLARVLWPMTVKVRDVFRDREQTRFDPSDQQGRHGYYQ